jgi:adenylate cyclase
MGSSPREDASQPALQKARRAIVVVDVVESVRLMQADEAGVIDRWRRFVAEVRNEVLPAHGGRLVKSLGDGMLLQFEQVPGALAAAQAIQRRIGRYNTNPGSEPIHLRVGVHVAEVVVDDLDIYGSGVNLAARLATLASPGEIALSAVARDDMVVGFDADIEDLGECFFKHIDEPVRAFRLHPLGPGLKQAAGVMPALRAAVAVLPFKGPAGDADHQAVGDLIAEEVVTSLSRTQFMTVISRLSAAAFAARHAGAAEIGQALGAEYVVSGSFHLRGAKLVVRAELAHAPSAVAIWAERIESTVPDLLAGADAAVPVIVAAVSKAVIQREIERSTSSPLPTLRSHSLLMSAIGHLHRSAPADFERAREALESLTERHARSPHAYAWLGKWYVLRTVQGLSADPQGDAKRAIDRAHRALDMDPNSALAMALAGHVEGFLRKDLDRAEAHLQDALRANPNEALTWLYLATQRAWQGRGAEAVVASERALALSPLDPMRYYFETIAAFAAMTAGDFLRAKTLAQASLRAHRLHMSTHRTLAIAQWNLGEHDAAAQTMQELLRIDPHFSASSYRARYPGGDTEQARLNARTLVACGAPP